MLSKDLEDTYSPGRHYRLCHNALIYSKYKAKSLDYEMYVLVTHRYCDQSYEDCLKVREWYLLDNVFIFS